MIIFMSARVRPRVGRRWAQQVAGGPLHQGAHEAGQGGHLKAHQDYEETAMLLKPSCKYCLNIV